MVCNSVLSTFNIVNFHKNGLGKQVHFLFAELLRFVLLSPYIKIRTCLFQGIDSPMRFRDASAHQGESATDFNFDDNFIEELMLMIAKISDFML